MSKIFLTANTFFGRKNALELPSRKDLYTSVEDMNQKMTDIWNSNVSENDIVYHLGYFAHDPITTSTIVEDLNGKIIFLNNNTDKSIIEISHLYDDVELINSQIVELVKLNSFLTYYPMEVWAGDSSYHFYGDDRIETNLSKVKKRMCISFDTWKRPIDIENCINLINEFELN